MIFDLIDYIFGLLKMLVYTIFYFGRVSFHINGKYSSQFQLRVSNKSKISFGKGVTVRAGVKIRLNNKGKLRVGNRVGFNNYCLINCMDSISIGDNVIFGQNIMMYDHDHNFKKQGIIRDNGFKTKPIVIGNNVWIGSNCVILKGTQIFDNSVIAANTVIKGVIPANSLVISSRNLDIKELIRE